MVELQPGPPTIYEYIVWLWAGTMWLEELRQVGVVMNTISNAFTSRVSELKNYDMSKTAAWRKLGKGENKCTSHKLILFAIFAPKIFTVGGSLTKFWQKLICTVFLRHGVYFKMLIAADVIFGTEKLHCESMEPNGSSDVCVIGTGRYLQIHTDQQLLRVDTKYIRHRSGDFLPSNSTAFPHRKTAGSQTHNDSSYGRFNLIANLQKSYCNEV